MSSASRFGTLALLYFVQGMPFGFQDKLLPLVLRESGSSYTQLSLMKLLLLPWLAKALWAPYIESYKTKKWWLQASMTAMALCCFACTFVTPNEDIALFSFALFLLNGLSAVQDIAVDCIAIKILKPSELGYGNSIQVVAYKAGMVFAGGVLLWIQLKAGWITTFIILGSTYVATVGSVVHIVKDTEGKRQKKLTETNVGIYKEIFRVPGTKILCLYVLLYKLGERGCLNNFPLLLLDKGLSIETLGFWNGLIAQGASICGSVYGGYITSSNNNKSTLIRYCTQRVILVGIQLVLVLFIETNSVFITVVGLTSIIYLNFVAGVITTVTFTLLMACSQRAPVSIQGSHYSTLATVELAGKIISSVLLGSIIDDYGWIVFYVLLVLLHIIVMPVIKNKQFLL